LCFNNLDTLYLKDNSYTPSSFSNLQIVKQVWKIDNCESDSLFGSEVAVVPKNYGLGNIRLTVTNEKDCESTTDFSVGSDYFRVDSLNPNFTTQSKFFCNKMNVIFRNQTSVFPESLHRNLRTPVTCVWDFGDGYPVQYQKIICGDPIPDISHQYDFPDKRTKVAVTLRAWLDDNPECEAVYIDTLTIIRPVAGFTDDGHIFPCPGSIGRQIQFTDTSDADGYIAYYVWIFGDPKSSSNRVEGDNFNKLYHSYESAGLYDVTLIVMDSYGCMDTVFKPQHVYIDGPAGEFTYTPLSGCVDITSVRFTPNIEMDNQNEYTADTVIWLPDGITPTATYAGQGVNYIYMWRATEAGRYIPLMQMIKWVDNNGTQERCVVTKRGQDTIWIIGDSTNIVEMDNYLSLRVYPNPTNGQLTISLPNPSEGGAYEMENVEIYDVVGKKQKIIINYQLSTIHSIDVSHLANGIYFLKVNNKVVKFVKQ